MLDRPCVDAWEPISQFRYYRTARIIANRLIDASDCRPALSPGETATDDTWGHASIAEHYAEEACGLKRHVSRVSDRMTCSARSGGTELPSWA